MRKAVLAALLLSACSKPAEPPAPAGSGGLEKIKVISKGEAYSLEGHFQPGYATVLYFYADW